MSKFLVFPGLDEQNLASADCWYRFADVRKVELQQWSGGRAAVYALVSLGPTLARVLVYADDQEPAESVWTSFMAAWVGASGEPWPRMWAAPCGG